MDEEREIARKRAYFLVASKILQAYFKAKQASIDARFISEIVEREEGGEHSIITNVEPESFVRSWLNVNIVGGTEGWDTGVFKVFMELLTDSVKRK